MNIESGVKKWTKCRDAVSVDPEITGSDDPDFACKNLEVQETFGRTLIPPYDSVIPNTVFILGTGKLEDQSVQKALDRTCGPCLLYLACQQETA